MSCCTKTTERRAGPTYTASVENHGDATYVATTRHSTFLMGTDGRGANPIDTLLASLCACVGHYARDYLQEANIPAAGFTVRGGATGTPDGARLAAIDVTIEVKGADLTDGQRAELLRAAEHCKIHNTLKAGCEVRVVLARAAATPEATAAKRPACGA
jgi:uncharacterized OsmC-like protein